MKHHSLYFPINASPPNSMMNKSYSTLSLRFMMYSIDGMIRDWDHGLGSKWRFISFQRRFRIETQWNDIKAKGDWMGDEGVLSSDVLLRRISFTEKQILQNIQRIGTKTQPPIHQSLITKLKNRLAADGNLERVHYKFRVDAVIDDKFRVLVRDILDELLKSRELIGVDESDFNPLFFDTITGAMVMDTDGGKGQLPWRCPCCGNLNVHKVIGYRMTTNISMCSICRVTQCEAITMCGISAAENQHIHDVIAP